MCSKDGDCTAGTNGRCVEGTGGPIYCLCTYDACMHDTDCAAGQACACHGSTYTFGAGNTCIQGNCRVDSDCGPGNYCSPSFDPASCGSLLGYFCHTPSDQCLDDSDCGDFVAQVCAYSATSSSWQCHFHGGCA
jgi:hypothetical protein